MERMGEDFFKIVPTGADAYSMRRIIHNWLNRDAAAILGRVRKAITPG
jgi:hypothetical protein